MAERSEHPAPPRADERPPGERRAEAFSLRAQRALRERQFPRAFAVGLFAGLVAAAFRATLRFLDQRRDALLAYARALSPWGAAIPVLACALLVSIGVWLVRRFAPETAGSGIPQVEAVARKIGRFEGGRVLWVKFIAGALAIGFGLTLGREGPTVQMGAATGALVARWIGCGDEEQRTLLTAGAGAGLAAAFNAPLGGMLFVLEELRREFSGVLLTAAFVACIIADVVSRVVVGQMSTFHVPVGGQPPLASLPLFALLGLAAGLLGVAYNRALLATLRLFARVKRLPVWLPGALVGALVGLVGFFWPAVIGGGEGLAADMLQGHPAPLGVPVLFAVRFGLFMLSYGSGAAGGIFAPLLVLGAALGSGVGDLGRAVFPHLALDRTWFAVAGMSAYFTAIVRAPLTGIVLILEMTGNQALLLPMLVACATAYALAEALHDRPIYEALLEQAPA